MNAIEKTLSRLEDALHFVGCAALITVAVLINADILMRLLLDRPVQIQFELTELYLMPALATLSLARVLREGGHLSLEFAPEHLFGAASGLVDRLIQLTSAVFFAAVTFKSGQFMWRAFARHEIEFGVIDWPLGWAYLSIPLGCGVLTLRLLLQATKPRDAESVQT